MVHYNILRPRRAFVKSFARNFYNFLIVNAPKEYFAFGVYFFAMKEHAAAWTAFALETDNKKTVGNRCGSLNRSVFPTKFFSFYFLFKKAVGHKTLCNRTPVCSTKTFHFQLSTFNFTKNAVGNRCGSLNRPVFPTKTFHFQLSTFNFTKKAVGNRCGSLNRSVFPT